MGRKTGAQRRSEAACDIGVGAAPRLCCSGSLLAAVALLAVVARGGAVVPGSAAIPSPGMAPDLSNLQPDGMLRPEGDSPLEVTVPGHYTNFKEAVEKYESGATMGTIVLRPGEHRWENFLELALSVNVRGVDNAVLPGTLWMKKGSSGALQTVEMTKDSGSCIIFEGGAWSLQSCRLQCSRWAVLWCRCDSEVMIKNCFLGGLDDGPGYCVNCQDQARTTVDGCHLERSSGEFSAALAVFHEVRVRVQGCNIVNNQFALRAVTAKDTMLEFINNEISSGGEGGGVWYDSSRPGAMTLAGNTADGTAIPDVTTDGSLPGGEIPLP